MVDLSLLIVNYNSWRLCVDALRSFLRFPAVRADGSELVWEAIIVDNCSPERDTEAEAELRQLIGDRGELILHNENGGYSKGMNLAYERCQGRLILVANPDVLFTEGCLSRLVSAAAGDLSIGAAAPRGFLDPSLEACLPPNILPTLGDLWGVTLANLVPRFAIRYSERRSRDAMRTWRAEEDVELDMLSGCCFVMRREVIEEIGFFDERFPLYYEDTDLSVRIKRSRRRVVQVAGADLVHLYDRSGQTAKQEALRRYWISRRAYYRKWYGWRGAMMYGACRWLAETPFGRRRGQLPPQPMIDLGSSSEPPRIELNAPCASFLVEMSLDPRFFLAAGTFGSGSHWSPGKELFAAFGMTTYFFRIVDLTRASQPQIGAYHYTRLPAASARVSEVEPSREALG